MTETAWDLANRLWSAESLQAIAAIGAGASALFAYMAAKSNQRSAEANERMAHLQLQHLNSLTTPQVRIRVTPPKPGTDSLAVTVQNVGMFDLLDIAVWARLHVDDDAVWESSLVGVSGARNIELKRGASESFAVDGKTLRDYLATTLDIGPFDKISMSFDVLQGDESLVHIKRDAKVGVKALTQITNEWLRSHHDSD